jgi:Zn-dependent protease
VVADREEESWKVYVAGPLANLGFAIVVYILFMLQPLPMLRLIAQVQLAAMGYALLPFAPLDGAALARRHPAVLGGLGSIALLLGVLFSVGVL